MIHVLCVLVYYGSFKYILARIVGTAAESTQAQEQMNAKCHREAADSSTIVKLIEWSE